MCDDQKEKNGTDTGHGNQTEAEERAALIREIAAALDGVPVEVLEQVYATLILLFERKKE